MDYETARIFAATWGLVGLVTMFVVVLAYTFWPKNKRKFDDAASIPLKEE